MAQRRSPKGTAARAYEDEMARATIFRAGVSGAAPEPVRAPELPRPRGHGSGSRPRPRREPAPPPTEVNPEGRAARRRREREERKRGGA